MELSCSQGIGFAGLGDVSVIVRLEEGSRHIDRIKKRRTGGGRRGAEGNGGANDH
jgi:hypothetical protein